MDCVDCHNRPTHVYQRPDDEMDDAMAVGELDKSLPFMRREGLRIIQAAVHLAGGGAGQGIKDELTDFYAKSYPELAEERAKRRSTPRPTALFEDLRRATSSPA